MTREQFDSLRERADELHDDGDYYKAIEIYSGLLEESPDDDEILTARSAAYLEAGEYPSAAEDAAAAWKIDPRNYAAAFNAGLAYDLDGESEAAVEWFLKAVETNPEFGKAYSGLANTYIQLEQYEEAVANYELAELHGPEFDDLYYWWGTALLKLGRYERAMECFERQLEQAPHAGAEAGVARTAYLLGDYERARPLLWSAVAKRPDDHDSLLYLSALLVQEGERAEDVVRTIRDQRNAGEPE
jgi:tetratricopeptide (TPR) repeat protein